MTFFGPSFLIGAIILLNSSRLQCPHKLEMLDEERNSSKFLQYLEVNFIQHKLSSYQPHLFPVLILGKTLDLSQGNYLCLEMKATLIALFVALLFLGCGRDRLVDYYDNGQKKWERHWKGQDLDGPVTWWYENGQKRQQLNYKDGKQHGPSIWWNENGKELYRKTYKDG